MGQIVDTVWITLSFYRECIIWAARGTLDRANSWFWIIGVPVVAICGYWLRLGTLIIPDELQGFFAFMIITVIASWLILFVLRFICAPAVLWDAVRNRAEGLAEQLRPKSKAYLKGTGVQTVKTVTRTLPPQDGPLSKWVQIFVESVSSAPLEACEVWITKLQRLENGASVCDLLHESVACNWSQVPTTAADAWRRTIPAFVPQAVNLFSLNDETGQPTIYPQFNHTKIELHDEIQKPGLYRLVALITASNSSPVTKTFLFEWGGSFDSVKLSECP